MDQLKLMNQKDKFKRIIGIAFFGSAIAYFAKRKRNIDPKILERAYKIEFKGSEGQNEEELKKCDFRIKTRAENMEEIKYYEQKHIDLLIVGGGAIGAGVAIEAARRGIKCAVIDANDFGTGSSSRSTKLAQGGMRNFEKMMKLEGDPYSNYKLLKIFM